MNKIIIEVLSKYGIRPKKWTIIKQENDRMVLKVEGENGNYVLKSLIASKAHNVSNITPYLSGKGIPVIAVLPALNGDFVVQSKKYKNSFILFPWFDGKSIHYEPQGTIERMSSLLAQFHEASRGYKTTGKPIMKILFYMLEEYKKRLEFMDKTYKKLVSTDDQIVRFFSKYYSWLQKRCNWVIKELPRTSYEKLIELAELDPILGHGDYSRANILSDKSGNWKIIDLDNVGLSLPFVDLSRMITWMNHDLRNWNSTRYQTILQSYRNVRPFSEEEEKLLIIDQCFPHQFIALMKRKVENIREIHLEELEKCLAIDREKISEFSIKELEWKFS